MTIRHKSGWIRFAVLDIPEAAVATEEVLAHLVDLHERYLEREPVRDDPLF